MQPEEYADPGDQAGQRGEQCDGREVGALRHGEPAQQTEGGDQHDPGNR